jgi:hypothetical protein
MGAPIWVSDSDRSERLKMRELRIKRIGVLSAGWLFAILWFCLYLIPLCINQVWGKHCEVTIISPFLQIKPASSLAIAYLLVVTPLLGFVTGIVTALFTNLALCLSGGIRLKVEIEPSEPGDTPNPHSPSAQGVGGR